MTTSTSPMAPETEKIIVWMALIVFALLTIWAFCFAPMSNDEPNHFHRLACFNAPFPDIEESIDCSDRYDLITPFGFKIPRSNAYTGSFAAFLYAPVYFLFHAPLAQLLYGFAFFVAFAYSIGKLSARPKMTFTLTLAFFPFLFNFVHDMGPVKFAILIYPLSALLLRKAARTEPIHAFFYLLGIMFLTLLAIEEKIFFLYVLPGYLLFLLAFTDESFSKTGKMLVRLKTPLLACGLIAAGLMAFFLLSTKAGGAHEGVTYFEQLLMMQNGKYTVMPGYTMEYATTGKKWFLFLLFWPSYAARFFQIELLDAGGNYVRSFHGFVFLCLTTATFLGGCFIGLLHLKERKLLGKLSPRVFFLIASFIATVLSFSMLGKVWAGHHFVFLWVPLLILFYDLLEKLSVKGTLSLVVLFLLCNIAPILWLSQSETLNDTSKERQAISAYFNEERAQNAIIAYIIWGHHYIQSLYGPQNQIVVVENGPNFLARLLKFQKETQRTVYFVCSQPNPLEWREVVFNDFCSKKDLEGRWYSDKVKLTVEDVLPGLKIWHVFKVNSLELRSQKSLPPRRRVGKKTS